VSTRPKITKVRGRSVPEWIGKTPDAKVPTGVVLRIWERHKGICFLTKVPIAIGEPWELCHIVALEDGGEHRESNLAPGLKSAHRKETGKENSQRADERRKRKAHVGIKKAPKRPLQSRGFAKTAKPSRELTKKLPPRRDVFTGEVYK
jgi:5-methylcytosine-specific restriction endonuclease McrA